MKNRFNQFIEGVTPFSQKYGLFIAPVLLFILFMTLIVTSYINQPKKSQTAISIPSQTQTNTNNDAPPNPEVSEQANTIPIPTYSLSPFPSSNGMDPDNDEPNEPVWSGASFSPSDFGNITFTQTTLSDGSTQYSYDSDTPNRPDIIIVKNGINVFQSTPMYNIPVDTSVGAPPDYIARGSQFWGDDAETYIYLSKGLADVIDTKNNQIVEEMIFEPGNLNQFEQYDTDMIGIPHQP